MKKLAVAVLCLLLIIPVCAGAKNLTVEEKFKKSFPENAFESIKPTSIKGVYEIYTGNQIFYFAPDADLLIYGNIVSKEGNSLTRESYLKKIAPKMAKLPLNDALKVGNGKNVVVEFMDPDCSHCRDAYRFFSQRKDVTVYVFFYPIFQNSESKIKHILCAADQLKMYEEVMQGKYDNNTKLNVCTDKKADEIIKMNRRLASEIGIRSTPFFYIMGQAIDGFEAPGFEKLLKN